jgi:predicted DNA-binding protein (UPF0251 family)
MACERLFVPIGAPLPGMFLNDRSIMGIDHDELEAMRLCDLEQLSQIEAAMSMQISRGTVQRLLESGRAKVMAALTEGRTLHVKNQ